MDVGKILKRAAFEVTFFFALLIMLPFHFVHALFLLCIEILKYYPAAIYTGVASFYYGEEDDEEDS